MSEVWQVQWKNESLANRYCPRVRACERLVYAIGLRHANVPQQGLVAPWSSDVLRNNIYGTTLPSQSWRWCRPQKRLCDLQTHREADPIKRCMEGVDDNRNIAFSRKNGIMQGEQEHLGMS